MCVSALIKPFYVYIYIHSNKIIVCIYNVFIRVYNVCTLLKWIYTFHIFIKMDIYINKQTDCVSKKRSRDVVMFIYINEGLFISTRVSPDFQKGKVGNPTRCDYFEKFHFKF